MEDKNMDQNNILNFISSSLFANICTFLSAIGTLGAVIVSLHLSRKNEKIKYKITRNFVKIAKNSLFNV